MTDTPESPERARLRAHFAASTPGPSANNQWNALWAENFIPWDKGIPSPALVDTLSQRKDILGSPLTSDGRRKRALVPGCGKGYDVLLLASYGYDAWGLEVSALAKGEAKRFAGEAEGKGEYGAVDEGVGKGEVRFVEGDFYERGWEDVVGSPVDLVYDYTFLCAMPPERRPDWALRMSQILAPGGHLVCLEFPLYKEPSTGGPPFGLREETYVEHLKRPGEKIPYGEEGFVVSEQGAKTNKDALSRMARWKPERTHKIGEGTDWLSIWSH